MAGSVGVMPMATIQPASAAATACSTARRNARTSVMTWSAAKEPTITSGSRRCRIAAASPIAAVESFGSLSSTMFASASSGICASTAARCARPVTTMTRSGPAIGASRSQVARSSELPEPVRSCRNLGASARDSGHSLDPIPPAGMML